MTRVAERLPSFRLKSWEHDTGLVYMAGLAIGVASWFGSPWFAVLLVACVVVALMPSTATVGADGLRLEWLGMRRFVRHVEIRDVYANDSGIMITLQNEKRVYLWGSTRAVAALAERLTQARTAAVGEHAEATPLLLRGARTVERWVTDLRALGPGASEYRAPVSPDRLWEMVEDAAADPTARAGAAVALGPSLDDNGRARLRVVAQATASPKLRVALDAACGRDDDRLERALADCGPEKPPQGRFNFDGSLATVTAHTRGGASSTRGRTLPAQNAAAHASVSVS
jgi:hypothetical protein